MLERVWRKGNFPTLKVGMKVGAATMENSMEVPQKAKSSVAIWSSNPTPGHTSRQNFNSKRYIHPYIHSSTIHNSTCHKTWKQPKCPSIEEWIKKMWYIYVYNEILLSQDKIMLFAATWMQLEIIILNEVNQKKINTVWYHLYVESKIWHKWTYHEPIYKTEMD